MFLQFWKCFLIVPEVLWLSNLMYIVHLRDKTKWIWLNLNSVSEWINRRQMWQMLHPEILSASLGNDLLHHQVFQTAIELKDARVVSSLQWGGKWVHLFIEEKATQTWHLNGLRHAVPAYLLFISIIQNLHGWWHEWLEKIFSNVKNYLNIL